MGVTLKDIIGLTKEIPEECFEETFEKLKEIKEKAERDEESKSVECLRCGSEKVVRNGKRNGRQAYLCSACGKTFVETATSAIAHSHSSKTVWKQVIRDTIDGVSIDKTAGALDLAHSTVFHMRHKILSCVERAILNTPGHANCYVLPPSPNAPRQPEQNAHDQLPTTPTRRSVSARLCTHRRALTP